MKLQDALELQKLPGQRAKTSLSAMEVAKRVFELSARYGEPYENQTPEMWKKDWLESERFILAEVGVEQVGIPYAKRIDPEKVRRSIAASADGQMEPIVVDLNRKQIGRTPMGYVPKVIVVDGKHRHRAQVDMGKDRVLAWVGERAMTELKNRQNGGKRFIMEAASERNYDVPMSNLLATATLYSAVAVKPSSAMTRQDVGDGGSRPTGGTQSPKWEAMGAGPGGGPGGSLGGGSGSNPATMRVSSYGTSEGVEKGWDSRGRGRKAVEGRGWTVAKDTTNTTQYKHDEFPGHRMVLSKIGGPGRYNWEHDDVRSPQPVDRGMSRVSLEDHLQKFHGGKSMDAEVGARSSGTLDDPDPSDTKVTPDPSDRKQAVDPSDRLSWNPDKPQMWAPGGRSIPRGIHKDKYKTGDSTNRRKVEPNQYGDPAAEQPGAGIGPRIKDGTKGASNSELADYLDGNDVEAGGPIKVKKIVTKKKKRIKAVAPPGREAQVLKLKKKFGEEGAFKIAWNSYNQGKNE